MEIDVRCPWPSKAQMSHMHGDRAAQVYTTLGCEPAAMHHWRTVLYCTVLYDMQQETCVHCKTCQRNADVRGKCLTLTVVRELLSAAENSSDAPAADAWTRMPNILKLYNIQLSIVYCL